MSGALLVASGISVTRGSHVALRPTDLELRTGETLGIYGPNGAGKSTLLQALAGLLPVATGRVMFEGRALGHDLVPLDYHRRIAAVFQEPLLLRGTVAHNVGMGLALRGIGRAERERRARTMLDQLRIAHLAARDVAGLSGGEAQRTSLARALVIEPDVLFLDEPFSALDQPTRRSLVGDLQALLRRQRTATLFVTHDFKEAQALCGRCAIIDAGTIIQIDSPATLVQRPASQRVSEIVGP